MNIGFPEFSDSFLQGQEILYRQFNDINFYVEDIEQENFYFVILKKLFPTVKFEKIFPLGGKVKVLELASQTEAHKGSVFLVDADFDHILGKKTDSECVFYLDRYSIENYLLEIDAIVNIIREEKPKTKSDEILMIFDLSNFLKECQMIFSELICHFLVVQKYNLGIKNVDLDMGRFYNFHNDPTSVKSDQLASYYVQIKSALNSHKPKIKIENQIRFFGKYFKRIVNAVKHIPGKYMLEFLSRRMSRLFSYHGLSLESFTYRLATHCKFESLNFLRDNIMEYLMSTKASTVSI